MALKDIQFWWQRIGCARNPGAHTGEELARDGEIAELRTALTAAESAAQAALAYDRAIKSCANDPRKMNSFCTADGDDLDSLYADWQMKAREVLE